MATLDNVNLFAVGGATDDTQDPLYPEYLELVKRFEEIKQGPTIPGGYPDAPSFASFKKDKQNELARQTLATELEAGNIKKAYEEGFTQLPIGEQLLYYINPLTGVPIETYETGYFADQAGFGLKSPKEFLLDFVNPSKFNKTPFKAEDPVSAAIAPLSAIGAAGGIGELANIPKAGLMALRRFQQKTMDGGGGGIGGLPEPTPQPAFDDAGYKSNVLEEAKAVEIDSGQALLDYLTSPKRQNPSNNKNGVALKKSEIDEIDFDAFKEEMNRVYPAGNFEKEELLEYIDDNRVKLYRVRRAEENPDIRTDDAFAPSEDVDFYLDEPLTNQIYGDSLEANYDNMFNMVEDQKVFFKRNFGPKGIITKETYQKYLDKPESGTEQNARKVFMNQFEADSLNPFFELDEPEFVFIRPDGTIDKDMSLVQSGLGVPQSMSYIEDALNQGFTIQPKVLDENFDVSDLVDQASQRKTEFESQEGLIDEAYRYVGDDDIFEIIGNTEDGYSVRLNGEFDFDNFDENMSFNEAELQVGQYIDREYGGGLGNIDNPAEPDDLINLVPEGVIKENQSLPTKYGEQYSDFRLPMGGATDYEEYTIHIKNPKTTTRYKLGTRYEPKHFGGGDELFHLRTTLRTDENGKKVLFVEEIQSDLHSTARSTQSDATYELPPKERQKTFEQLNNIFQDLGITGERTDTGDFIFKNKQGENQSLDADNLRFIARDIRRGRTENFGSKNANDFVDTFGLEKTQEIGDMLAKLNQGNLPDFPYKKDWVDMAVKEAMKIGVEKGADRVAFVNAPTQIARNNKNLIYVQDRIITKMPTKEELINTPEFKSTYEQNLTLRYEDYVNRSHDTNQPIPTQEEFYASIPKARKRIKEINKESSKIAREMDLKYLDDVKKFRQQYPDSTFVEEDFGGLTPSGFEFEKAYRDLADAEIQILSNRMNDAFDITSDPRNVDITNPALARMLDADLDFREIPAEINDKFTEIKKLNVEKDYLDSIAYRDKEQIKEVTQEQLINDLELNRPFRVEDVGYVVEGDEILNPQRTQLVGDDYDEQRINFRRLTNEDELLEEIPEKFREQVKKDLAAGKKEITLNIDDLEGSGKKFLEIYKNEIPRGINKVLKDLKVKDGGPNTNISGILYADDPIDSEELFSNFRTLVLDTENKDQIYDIALDRGFAGIKLHKAIGIDLTDEMKRKIIQEGLSSMYMGGKVTKSKFMDRPIEGNRREM